MHPKFKILWASDNEMVKMEIFKNVAMKTEMENSVTRNKKMCQIEHFNPKVTRDRKFF